MEYRQLHRWDVTPRRAAAIQASLRGQLTLRRDRRRPRLVAGADVSYDKGSDRIHAAVVVLTLDGLETVESRAAVGEARFPYIPGYLSFREAPIVLRAFRKLRSRPDLLLCDGQGIAHPRGFGLASHLGLLLDLPTIGCAKSRLVGDHAQPGPEAGSRAPLMYRGRQVGSVLRTRDGANPIFVSPGHRIGLRSSVHWSLACCDGHRIPEPTRRAHIEVNRARNESNARRELP